VRRCAGITNPTFGFPILQLIQHAAIAENQVRVINFVDILCKEDIDYVRIQSGYDLSPRRHQGLGLPRSTARGDDRFVAISPSQSCELLDERFIARTIKEKVVDPAVKGPPHAARILLRARG
jgi:hypothetical protein